MWTIEFSNPVFLWLIILIPILLASHFFFLRRTQIKALNFANFVALKRISGKRLVTKNLTVLFLRIIIFAAFILAISGATIYYDGLQNDFDYVIAIDSSSSMSATDLTPTRFDAAKIAAIDFLNSLDSKTSVGVVDFSGVTYVLNPLTDDFFNLKFNINTMEFSRVSGTDISGAIVTATNLFTDETRGKTIILLTDGSDTVGAYLENNVNSAASYAASKNVMILPIGLGSEDSLVGYLPADFNLSVGMNPKTLESIANITGGYVVYPTTTNELVTYFQDLDALSTESKIAFELDRYALLFGFVFLVIEWILINLIFRRVV